MCRWLSILLLALLPLQFSWAAVKFHCQHEAGAAAKHLGHHDHRHQVDASQDDKTDSKTSGGGIDNDCGACHAGCAAVIVGEIRILVPPRVSAVVDDYRHSPSASPHYPPERPNWLLLV